MVLEFVREFESRTGDMDFRDTAKKLIKSFRMR